MFDYFIGKKIKKSADQDCRANDIRKKPCASYQHFKSISLLYGDRVPLGNIYTKGQ